MSQAIEIGRLLRAGTSGFVAGLRVDQSEAPAFGNLVRVPLGAQYQVFGLIHDIHINDDGLVRQLVTAERVSDDVIRDNRQHRIVPVELSVLAVGYELDGAIEHLLPPRPPLSLDLIYLCDAADLARFTADDRFGYLRHIVYAQDLPVAELLAAHARQVQNARADGLKWKEAAMRELIALLRDDYTLLMAVMSALNETGSQSFRNLSAGRS